MSILPLLIVVGIIAIIAACFVHGLSGTTMPRSKFVFLALMGAGSLPLGYVALWAVADQQPIDFDLAPLVAFGLTLWTTALAYSALHTLLQKDSAPSR